MCVWVGVCVWVRGRETSDIFGRCFPLHGPGTTSVILRALSPTRPSLYYNSTLSHLSLHNSSFLISRMFILINPSPTHLILTRPTHTSHSHPNYLTLHSTLCYPTTLPRSPTTHSPTLFSLPLRANSTHTLPSPSYLTPSNSNFIFFNVLE